MSIPLADVPSWFAELRARRGQTLDPWVLSLGRYLMMGDPLADDLVRALASLPPGHGKALFEQALARGVGTLRRPPAPLRAFFEAAEAVPHWVDWRELDAGGAVFLRAGPLCAVAIMCGALPMAYASPDGNKPLALSGRLAKRAARRLFETAHFMDVTSVPGGLRRFAPGWQTTLRVRLMHAQVRRLLVASNRWSSDRWGTPINQVYMAGTNVIFSAGVVEGLRMLGMTVAPGDADALVALWRYSGHLSGVAPELTATSMKDGLRLHEAIMAMAQPPDDDSRELVGALMEIPLGMARTSAQQRVAATMIPLFQALARVLVGDPLADDLGLPRRRSTWMLPRLGRLLTRELTGAVRLLPGARGITHTAGEWLWRGFIARGLGDQPATYAPPAALGHDAPDAA